MSKLAEKITFDRVIIAAAIVIGVIAGTTRLGDNSMLVHIRTGVTIIDTHHVPHSDPYSFTAHGDRWIVQSWLPEVIYGALWKLGGGHAIQIFHMLLFGSIAGLLAWLSRTGNFLKTGLVAFTAIGLGFWQWTTRPTSLGLLFFILMLVIVQKKMKPYWLVPLGVVWVNTHGTWLLGVVWFVLMMIGARFDKATTDKRNADAYLNYALALAGGVVVGGLLSPAGWRILTFPAIGFGARSAVFHHIVEWKSPNFAASQFLKGTIVLIAVICMIGVLSRRRQCWSVVVVVVAFIAAGLISQRNMPILGAVVAPIMALALIDRTAPDADDERPESPKAGIAGVIAISLLLLAAVFDIVVMFTVPAFNFDGYPVKALQYLESQGLTGPNHKIAAPDTVGCYRIFKDGSNANVFIDDRYDMYPPNVSLDAINLAQVTPDVQTILGRYHFDALLYRKDSAIATYLRGTPGWKMTYSDDQWQIFQPVMTS